MLEIIRADLALPDHAAALMAVLDEYARDPMGGSAPLAGYTKANLVAELRKRNTAHVTLAFDDREPAGVVICFEGFSTFACRPLLNIHDVAVSPQYRGRGLSKLMLEHVEELAIELGCCKLTLEVLEGNTIAQAAYRSLGFTGYELDPAMGRALFWEKKLKQSSRPTVD